jgi:hypothetical protein
MGSNSRGSGHHTSAISPRGVSPLPNAGVSFSLISTRLLIGSASTLRFDSSAAHHPSLSVAREGCPPEPATLLYTLSRIGSACALPGNMTAPTATNRVPRSPEVIRRVCIACLRRDGLQGVAVWRGTATSSRYSRTLARTWTGSCSSISSRRLHRRDVRHAVRRLEDSLGTATGTCELPWFAPWFAGGTNRPVT